MEISKFFWQRKTNMNSIFPFSFVTLPHIVKQDIFLSFSWLPLFTEPLAFSLFYSLFYFSSFFLILRITLQMQSDSSPSLQVISWLLWLWRLACLAGLSMWEFQCSSRHKGKRVGEIATSPYEIGWFWTYKVTLRCLSQLITGLGIWPANCYGIWLDVIVICYCSSLIFGRKIWLFNLVSQIWLSDWLS